MRVAQEITLTTTERSTLERWSAGRAIAMRQVERARIILLAADGRSNQEIASALAVKPHTVGRWRSRFAELRLVGIEKDLPRGGRPRSQREEVESQIIRQTTQRHADERHALEYADPGGGAGGHPVDRAARLEGERPQAALFRTFKLSNDPRFARSWSTSSGCISIRRSMRWC